ncbi:hypothetical protein JFL47_09375 [Haemophilus haemoglobinophilus]|nr:hypothetical protein [Canicola haemoglobinophilus]MBN6711430.1 hypothetical protein [Canicola haemoglobinophilus]
MKINRELQKSILLKLAESYPQPNPSAFEEEVEADYTPSGIAINFIFPNCTRDECITNLFYLQEHELVSGFFKNDTYWCNFYGGRLTHKGIDFLLDDGGLSAILGVISVKFHEDTIKGLLSAKIEESDLPEQEKSTLKQSIKNLSGKALEQAISNLVDLGFQNADNAIPLLQKMFGLMLSSAS